LTVRLEQRRKWRRIGLIDKGSEIGGIVEKKSNIGKE